MAAVHTVLQAGIHLSCRSRGDDSRTVQTVSPLSYNPAHPRPSVLIWPKEPISTSNDQPALYMAEFLGHKRDQSSDSISSRDQVFPGFAQFHVFESLFL